MPQKKNMCQRDENDLFDERVPQRVDSVIDESAAVVERDDLYVLRKSGLDLLHLLFDALMTSSAFVP